MHLRALSKEEIETLQQQKCVPLASKLRFIPKPNGLRPVITLNSVVGAENLRRNKKVLVLIHYSIGQVVHNMV